MKAFFTRFAPAALLLSAALIAPAQAATLDFESTAIGTYSNLTFGPAAITFTAGNGMFQVVSASPGAPINNHALISYFNNPGPGSFEVNFASMINSFSLGYGDYTPSDVDQIHMIAYDAANNIVDTFNINNPGNNVGGFGTLNGANISRVQFYEDGPFAGAIYWDQMSYTLQDRVVPEPGSLALFGLGIAGLVAYRRKQAKR
jgi:hypothetical protein